MQPVVAAILLHPYEARRAFDDLETACMGRLYAEPRFGWDAFGGGTEGVDRPAGNCGGPVVSVVTTFNRSGDPLSFSATIRLPQAKRLDHRIAYHSKYSSHLLGI